MKILHRLSTKKMHTSRETHELWVQTPANLRPCRVHPADAAACQLLRVLHLRMFRIAFPGRLSFMLLWTGALGSMHWNGSCG